MQAEEVIRKWCNTSSEEGKKHHARCPHSACRRVSVLSHLILNLSVTSSGGKNPKSKKSSVMHFCSQLTRSIFCSSDVLDSCFFRR